MGKGHEADARRVFDSLAMHLASKRNELRVAIEHERGVEGWFQHEALVALDNAYWGDLAGRLSDFSREGLRHESSTSFDEDSRRRPFDLVFAEPEMVASLKLYMPWQPLPEAVRDVRRDLLELRDHPDVGFIVAGRLDFLDGKTSKGTDRRGAYGDEWLEAVMAMAQGPDPDFDEETVTKDLRLRSLVDHALDPDANVLNIELPPVWRGDDRKYQDASLFLGGWQVLRTSS